MSSQPRSESQGPPDPQGKIEIDDAVGPTDDAVGSTDDAVGPTDDAVIARTVAELARAERARYESTRGSSAASGDDAPESLPFDQYQRYRLVADLVERVAAGARLQLLDLGGRTGVLRRFLPGHAIVLVDVEASDLPGLVLGDGSRLPFRAGAFDLVVACDTLEHVPPARRDDFLREAARVARRGVILAGPYRTASVEEAEDLLRGFLREKLRLEHRYLDEHRDQGLPDLAATERALRALGARTATVGHGNLERWLALQCLSLYMDEDIHLRSIAKRMFRFYNRALYPSDRAEPVYRHALFAALGDQELPSFEDLFAQPIALSPSLAPFADLVAELAAFDRERDVYDAERRRMEEVNRGLVRDLALHKQAKAVLEKDLAGHKAVLSDARARSAQLAKSLAAVEADLAGHRKLAATLGKDLDGHRALLMEIRREIAEHAKLARALESELRVREQEAQRTNEIAVAINADLVASLAANAQLGKENEGLRAEIDRQRAELRSRWKNLKRAFKWRKPNL